VTVFVQGAINCDFQPDYLLKMEAWVLNKHQWVESRQMLDVQRTMITGAWATTLMLQMIDKTNRVLISKKK